MGGRMADSGGEGAGESCWPPGDEENLSMELYGAKAGWVEAQTNCAHLPAMPAASADELAHVPAPDSHCSSDALDFIHAVEDKGLMDNQGAWCSQATNEGYSTSATQTTTVKAIRALQYFPTIEDASIRQTLFELQLFLLLYSTVDIDK